MIFKNAVKILSITVLAIGVLLGTSLTASASLITQTFNFGMADTDWTENLNIAQLNLSPGGVLNNVTITETVDWTALLTGTNIDHSSSVKVTKDQAELQLYDSITGDSTPLFDQSIGYNNHTGITLAPGVGHNFGSYISTNSYTYDYAGAGNTAQFLGVGVMPLQVSTFTQNNESTTGGGHFVSTQNTEANLNVQVTYDYSGSLAPLSVPEPSAGILLGVGSLLCWGWRRKVARKA